jgi:hypothetical protein
MAGARVPTVLVEELDRGTGRRDDRLIEPRAMD